MNRTVRRTPGRLIVFGIIAFVLGFLVVGFVLAYRLTPVAERWRSDFEPPKSKTSDHP